MSINPIQTSPDNTGAISSPQSIARELVKKAAIAASMLSSVCTIAVFSLTSVPWYFLVMADVTIIAFTGIAAVFAMRKMLFPASPRPENQGVGEISLVKKINEETSKAPTGIGKDLGNPGSDATESEENDPSSGSTSIHTPSNSSPKSDEKVDGEKVEISSRPSSGSPSGKSEESSSPSSQSSDDKTKESSESLPAFDPSTQKKGGIFAWVAKIFTSKKQEKQENAVK